MSPFPATTAIGSRSARGRESTLSRAQAAVAPTIRTTPTNGRALARTPGENEPPCEDTGGGGQHPGPEALAMDEPGEKQCHWRFKREQQGAAGGIHTPQTEDEEHRGEHAAEKPHEDEAADHPALKPRFRGAAADRAREQARDRCPQIEEAAGRECAGTGGGALNERRGRAEEERGEERQDDTAQDWGSLHA